MQDGKKQQDTASWNYTSSANNRTPQTDIPEAPKQNGKRTASEEDALMWTASEYLAHDKNATWYLTLAAGVVLFAALTFLITRDLISTSIIGMIGITIGIFAARKPNVLQYELTERAVKIAGKPYNYSLFKSFTVHQEGGMPSVELMPLRRFMPPLTIYFDPQDADVIVNVIGHYLPHEQRDQAMVDRMMHRLRF